MRTFQNFTGINNVLAREEIGAKELAAAVNVDVDLAGRLRRRAGYSVLSALAHANVWAATGFTLATRGGAGDLVNVEAGTVLVAGLGHAPRVWYCNLPDGRTAYSNGIVCGIVSATGATPWGVPIPTSAGVASSTAGSLHPGDYQWALTHVRLSDGLESGTIYSAGAVTVSGGGVALTSIPVRAGYRTNVYLSSHFGGERFFAGSTTGSTFTFTGSNKDLQRSCATNFMQPAPAGRLLAFWRGRALLAVGGALFASRPHAWELFDLQRDFKPFAGAITLVQPVEGGIFVGTEEELVFLAGSKFDDLARRVCMPVGVALGSGVRIPGKQLRIGKDIQQAEAMMCIAGGRVVAGTAEGAALALTEGVYRAEATEFAATFRMVDDIPQYIAVPQ